MTKAHDITVIQVPVEEIEPHPDNANKGDLAAITESVRINGFYSALIVQSSSGYILAGNHRYLAAKQLGYKEVPVIYLDVNDEEAKRIMVVDNRTTRLGSDDSDLIRMILEDLGDSDVGLLGTGYSHADLQTLQDAADKFDTALLAEPDAPKDASIANSDFTVEALEGAGGTCTGVLVARYDKEPLTAEDYNHIRVALGLGRASRGVLASTGIEDWA